MYIDWRLFLILLSVLLMSLKLTNIIDWDWFWILFPALTPIIVMGGWLFFLAIFAVFIIYVERQNKKRREANKANTEENKC